MVLHSHGHDGGGTGSNHGVLREDIRDNDCLLPGADRVQCCSLCDGGDRGNGASFLGRSVQYYADCIGFVSASYRGCGKLGGCGYVFGAGIFGLVIIKGRPGGEVCR